MEKAAAGPPSRALLHILAMFVNCSLNVVKYKSNHFYLLWQVMSETVICVTYSGEGVVSFFERTISESE